MFGATKLYWWCIALGFGITIMFLLNHESVSTLLIATGIAGMVFTADPDQVITGSET